MDEDDSATSDYAALREEIAGWRDGLVRELSERAALLVARETAQLLRDARVAAAATEGPVDEDLLERAALGGCLVSSGRLAQLHEEKTRIRLPLVAHHNQRVSFVSSCQEVKMDRVCFLLPAVPPPCRSHSHWHMRLFRFSNDLQAYLTPPQSFWTLLLCLKSCGIWLPRDLRMLLLRWVAPESPLLCRSLRLQSCFPLPRAIRLWSPIYVRVSAGSLRCVWLKEFQFGRHRYLPVVLQSRFELDANGEAVRSRLRRIEAALIDAVEQSLLSVKAEELRFSFGKIAPKSGSFTYASQHRVRRPIVTSACVNETLRLRVGERVDRVLFIQILGIAPTKERCAQLVMRLLLEDGRRIA